MACLMNAVGTPVGAVYLSRARRIGGAFRGKITVTMRCFPPDIAAEVADFTSHFPRCHGGPIAIDDPASLGIADEYDQHLAWPGKSPEQTKLYWACGICQAALRWPPSYRS